MLFRERKVIGWTLFQPYYDVLTSNASCNKQRNVQAVLSNLLAQRESVNFQEWPNLSNVKTLHQNQTLATVAYLNTVRHTTVQDMHYSWRATLAQASMQSFCKEPLGKWVQVAEVSTTNDNKTQTVLPIPAHEHWRAYSDLHSNSTVTQQTARHTHPSKCTRQTRSGFLTEADGNFFNHWCPKWACYNGIIYLYKKWFHDKYHSTWLCRCTLSSRCLTRAMGKHLMGMACRTCIRLHLNSQHIKRQEVNRQVHSSFTFPCVTCLWSPVKKRVFKKRLNN